MVDRLESRGCWRTAAGIVALSILLAMTLQVPHCVRKTFKPPGNARTFAAFVREQPEKRHLARIERDGNHFYVWHGEVIPLALPSGPSCFVFDARGHLVAYTATTGDLELAEFCDVAWQESDLGVDSVARAIREVNAAPLSASSG